MRIGQRLKQARLARQITQEDLAKLVGVTKGAIGNYETGVSSPKEPILVKLMEVLGIDANYLYQDFIHRSDENQARLEALHQNPRLGLLFDRSSKMKPEDVDVMIRFAEGILRERDGDAE